MSKIRRPCINCGELTDRITRCARCQPIHDSLYDYEHRQRSASLRAVATHCHICGKAGTPDDPLHADHIISGRRDSPLQPAHRSCNTRKGGTTR